MSTMQHVVNIVQSIQESMTSASQYDDYQHEFKCIESLVKHTPLQMAFDSFILKLTLNKGCLGDCQEEFRTFVQNIR